MSIILLKSINENSALGIWNITEDIELLLENWKNKYSLLDKSEIEKINSFQLVQRKKQWIVVRLLVYELLKMDITIDYDEFGKPFLINSEYNISISHSHEMVAVLVTRFHEAGLDIERISERIIPISKKFLNHKELNFINKTNMSEHLIICWSVKEALYKIHGKRKLEFRTDLYIYPFPFSNEGKLTGSIKTDNKIKKYEIFFFRIKNFFVAYSCC
jgi:phosphopantetheinyl transferase (holo-ACP synthase)